jgi:alkanesulfonate monooxygenase SsuD/methylene tetrahydromethanopterin reductase-like flavin-dependent oxidoreductase (luciferase family)
LLAGQTVTTDGRYVRLRDVTLDWPPAEPPAVHIGAIGPKTMALAAELGDGTVLTGASTADDVRRARAGAAGHRITVFLAASADPARIASDVADLGAAGADAVAVFATGDGGDAEQLVQLLDDGVRPLLGRTEDTSP